MINKLLIILCILHINGTQNHVIDLTKNKFILNIKGPVGVSNVEDNTSTNTDSIKENSISEEEVKACSECFKKPKCCNTLMVLLCCICNMCPCK